MQGNKILLYFQYFFYDKGSSSPRWNRRLKGFKKKIRKFTLGRKELMTPWIIKPLVILVGLEHLRLQSNFSFGAGQYFEELPRKAQLPRLAFSLCPSNLRSTTFWIISNVNKYRLSWASQIENWTRAIAYSIQPQPNGFQLYYHYILKSIILSSNSNNVCLSENWITIRTRESTY